MAGKKLYFSGLLNFDPPETISGRFKNETVPPWGSKTTSKKKIIQEPVLSSDQCLLPNIYMVNYLPGNESTTLQLKKNTKCYSKLCSDLYYLILEFYQTSQCFFFHGSRQPLADFRLLPFIMHRSCGSFFFIVFKIWGNKMYGQGSTFFF